MPAPTAKTATPFHPFTGRDLPWLVDAQAALRPEKVFLVWEPFVGERRTWTYAEFAEETRRYAAGLSQNGIVKGDFVTIHLDNCPEFLFAWYALSRLGAVAVTTNTNSALEELEYFLSHSGSVAVITQPKFADLVRRAAKDVRWIACTETDGGQSPDVAGPSDLLAFGDFRGEPDKAPVRPAEPLWPNSVQYTSGTTARPKGVVWTHANTLWSGRVGASHAFLTAEDCVVIYFPLFHSNALAWSMLSTLWSGGTAVLMPKFSASRFWDVAIRNRCTWANQVPFTWQAIMAQVDPERHFFRFWVGGDGPTNLKRWGVKTIGWFGMTETVSQNLFCDQNFDRPPLSIGWPAPEYEISIRRDDGGEVAFGEIGRLWIRGIPGISLFLEYLNNPEATAEVFDDEGWFDTGDQVTPLEDGHIIFAGRAKDMLKVGAENVAAIEIESVIARVPGVREVAVVGKPDKMLDEVPAAFVVAAEPGQALETAIMAECELALSSFKRPREIHFVDALPKGTLDKVLKKELRARLSA